MRKLSHTLSRKSKNKFIKLTKLESFTRVAINLKDLNQKARLRVVVLFELSDWIKESFEPRKDRIKECLFELENVCSN